MKVLFVASGNKVGGKVNSFVQSQYDSLEAAGLEMRMFPVVGHGVGGYLSNVKQLRRQIDEFAPDIVHSHYSTCGFLTTIALIGKRNRPKSYVSILGSFPEKNLRYRVIRWFIEHVWDGALVKSERTRAQLDLQLPVVPNGVNLSIFHPMSQAACREQLGWESGKKYVVWCSSPARPEKNWALAEAAIKALSDYTETELVAVYNKTPQEVAIYMNAADCVLMTSNNEGSPNVIKEAMACSRPIVTTNVGDVSERLTGVENTYYTHGSIWTDSFDSLCGELNTSLHQALTNGPTSNGNEAIIAQGLGIEQVAERIINLYKQL